MLEVLEGLLCVLESLEGVRRMLEVLEGEAMCAIGAGGRALCAGLYTGGHGGCPLCARAAEGCALLAGCRRERSTCRRAVKGVRRVLRVLEAMRYVL